MAELFPKITAESAEATPFEFSSITIETDNSFEPSTDQAHSGSYSYKAYYGGTNDVCNGRRNFTESTTVYIVAYLYIPASYNFPVGSSHAISMLDGNSILVELRLRRVTGQDYPTTFYESVRSGTSGNISGFATAQWLKIALWYKSATTGNTDGESQIWVNDTSVFSAAHSTTFLPDNVRFSETGFSGTSVPVTGSAIYFDDIEGNTGIPSNGSKVPIIMQYMNQFNGGMM